MGDTVEEVEYARVQDVRPTLFSMNTEESTRIKRNSRFSILKELEDYCPIDTQQHLVPLTEYLTGSTYRGECDHLGMSGYGTYTFPNGVEYKGNFRDGNFHGKGTLIYPMGQKLFGVWSNGQLVSWTYQFKDGLQFDDTWRYCKYPDRRYFEAMKRGFNPAGRERVTNDPSPRKIPTSCYDAGDGFYNAENKYIFSIHNDKKILRIPHEGEMEWIKENCRTAWDEAIGCKPELYPDSTTGRKASTENLLAKHVKEDDENISKIFQL